MNNKYNLYTDKTGKMTLNKIKIINTFIYNKKNFSEKILNYIMFLNNDAHINKEGKEIRDPIKPKGNSII